MINELSTGFDPSFPEAPLGAAHDEFRDALMAKNSRIALVGFSREKSNFRDGSDFVLSIDGSEFVMKSCIYLQINNCHAK